MIARARGPQTAAEQAVWTEIERIMGTAIRARRRVDWMAVFAEMRRPPRGVNAGACTEVGCGRYAVAKGLCATHYRRVLADRPNRPRCQVPGCEGELVARGWCSRHYQRWRKTQRAQGSS